LVLAYQLTAASVPEHRAALERLVRAHTGLDLRFEELALRWGWYGPEAVFSQVELGEPERDAALLRAPELIVSFDAWRTLQSGHLQAGRITLVSPDIDLPRPAGASGARAPDAASGATAATTGLLERWRDGRIDFEGGTLHLFDPAGKLEPLTVSIRRAAIFRAGNEWSAQALVLLPERLGSTARIDVHMHGAPSDAASLTGSVRFAGVRLVFAGWRELLQDSPELAQRLPSAGGGDVTLRADILAGRVVNATGEVRAGGVEFTDARSPMHPLLIDRVRGDWRVSHTGRTWHAQIDDLQVGRSQSEAIATSSAVRIDWGGSHLRARAMRLPLESVAAAAAWLVPEIDIGGMEISGTARDLNIDWDGARAAGSRLVLHARAEDISVAPAGEGFAVTGLTAHLSGDERAWQIDLGSRDAELHIPNAPLHPVIEISLATHLDVSRTTRGLELATDDLDIGADTGRLRISGSLTAPRSASAPVMRLQGVLADVDVALLQELFGAQLRARFGAAAERLQAGRIDDAHFSLNAPGAFAGALTLTNAAVADDPGLAAQGIDARIEWNDARIKAIVARGAAGPLQLGPMTLSWRADGHRPVSVGGHATGALEDTLAWVREHQQLRDYVPQVPGLAARGAALFDFDIAVRPDGAHLARAAQRLPHARIAVSLEDATVQTGPGVPPLEAVRGALAFEGGHLQRSLLTARWLGGPVTLRLAERAEPRAAFSVKAQGLMDVRELAALGTFADPAALSGQAEWSGEFLLTPDSPAHAAQWQARLDASLTEVASALPEPLTKAAGIAAPLHIDVAGSSARAQLRCALADRLHSVFEIVAAGDDAWRVERGSVRFGGMGPVALAAERAVVISGRLPRLEPTPYVAAWNRVRHDVILPRVSGGVFVSELLAGRDVYPDANLKVRRSGPGLDLTIEPFIAGGRPGT
jgi:uncharacterized protein YhdP